MQELHFTPKARLIKILGEQLIKDATVGIIELVKNSYDADATKVEIVMHSLNTPDAKIVIRDNGSGMNLPTFTTKWMNPATGHKEEQKENKQRSKLKRLPLGEKGVGRFAAQQIGHHLKMITKTIETEQELFVDVDWKLFDVRGKDLQDVKVNFKMQNTDRFKYKETGTILEITNLKSEWTPDEIKKVSNSLRRMKSPFKGANNFDVTLKFENCPVEFEKYADLETTDILDKAHYTFYAIVNDKGEVDYDYEFKMPGFKKVKYSDSGNIITDTKERPNLAVTVGEFLVNLHVYDRTPSRIKSTNINKKDLDEWCGVSVYRDGIRIMPYGEKGNDWLKLDNRRIQRPGELVGNDQVIGMIEINQDSNIHLKDKTNREGLIEDEYYEKFRSLTLGAISIFEALQKDDRKKLNPPKEKTKAEDLNSRIDFVVKEINDISKIVENRDDEVAVKAKASFGTIGKNISDIKQQVSDTIEELEKDKQILFNLAGTGLAAERFTHEFARLISGAISSLARLKKYIDENEKAKAKKEFDSISGALEALRNDIRLLGPMFYIKKVAKEKDLNIREIIQNTISLQEPFIEKAGIEMIIEGGNFNVVMREGSCMQVFNNLIDNAVFWTGRKSETDKRKIKIIIDEKEKSVYVSDSGAGIASRYRDKIFDPFFSMKGEDGRGLGLYIVKEILDEKNFGIYLVTEEDYKGLLSGASFKLVFNDNKE
ncbi:MAG TPA: sensor histidine kinase [Bacteroidia bacterium]|nr:sensor histidine kinase [Bacteroidia bacterium]HNU32895.1 sensor histidine kinase [Bacteroidia bacterium]